MSDFLQVHIAQMTSVDSVERNVEQVLDLLSSVKSTESSSAGRNPQLVCFPENSLYFRICDGESIPAVSLDAEFWTTFVHRARELNAYLHFGSVPIRGKYKLLNSTVVVDPAGEVRSTYGKMHLFDIDIEGHRPVRESDVFEPGAAPQILQVGSWRFGQSICYDLRFSELYGFYARESVDALLVPSAFLVPTGKAHWEVLLRARAVENQAYVIAAAQAGTHRDTQGRDAERQTYGHSLCIDPWGRVLTDAETAEPSLHTVVLSREEIEKVRRQIPMQSHRRSSLKPV